MVSWNSLPIELRLIILQYVAGQNPSLWLRPRASSARRCYRWAPYAAVSRDWQIFFERRTFASILLFNDDVQPFCDAVGRCTDRLAYVGQLGLTIDLPEYTCGECETDEDAATVKRHNVIFTHYLWPLLRALAAWRISGQEERRISMRTDLMYSLGKFNSAVGIQLELGVRSISDSQHAFRDYRLHEPHGITRKPSSGFFRYYCNKWHQPDTNHGWLRIMRNRPPLPAAIRRLFGARLLKLDADGLGSETETGTGTKRGERYLMRHEPPAAAIVRKLVLSRQFYRAVHPATLSYLLGVCFPRIEYVHLEPWRPVDAENLVAMERGYCALLANLPPSLLHLSIFLESNRTIHQHGTSGAALTDRRPSPRLGRQLAKASGSLGLINVAFLAEADDFFAAVARLPDNTWPQLRAIVLTSSTLTPTSSAADIEKLLLAAAAAAARMPQFREIELWYARGRHACAFTVSNARLTLRATWNMARALTAEVVRAWRAVYQEKRHRYLDVTTELWTYPKRPVSMDARILVLEGDTLAKAWMHEPSLINMITEWGPFWKSM